jgi:rhamnulokinase
MGSLSSFAAVDLGASSGRVILGSVSEDSISYTEVHRFGNGAIARGHGLYWDISLLRENVFLGLAKLAQANPVSIGVDSWAVDFGLVDAAGQLIREPHHYRDERNMRGVSVVQEKISAEDLYSKVGLQFQPFNTLYQLAVDQTEHSALLDRSEKMLLIPDLFNFWLSGEMVSERTNASTTGLLDPYAKTWHEGLVSSLGFHNRLLPEVVPEGITLSSITADTRAASGLHSSTKVVTVGSHDTASAFVAVPATKPNSLFISSGTWSLIGVELDKPILTEAARKANFTNEGGVDGRVRFLKNVAGLWLIQESVRQWRLDGKSPELSQLLLAAQGLPKRSVFDVNQEMFISPGDMPSRIQNACRESGQWVPQSEAEIVRTIFDSLVEAYVKVIDELEQLTGSRIERIHIVGGGSQNTLLNQLTADATGLEVLAGPVEATALGNLVVQARSAGVLKGSLEDLRRLIAKSFDIKVFLPTRSGDK